MVAQELEVKTNSGNNGHTIDDNQGKEFNDSSSLTSISVTSNNVIKSENQNIFYSTQYDYLRRHHHQKLPQLSPLQIQQESEQQYTYNRNQQLPQQDKSESDRNNLNSDYIMLNSHPINQNSQVNLCTCEQN